jgi:hypothetical protein
MLLVSGLDISRYCCDCGDGEGVFDVMAFAGADGANAGETG